MTDKELQDLLDAIGRTDLRLTEFSTHPEAFYFRHRMEEIAATARLANAIADRPDKTELYPALADELGRPNGPLPFLRSVFESSGVSDALDRHLEVIRPHLNVSAIPKEDLEFLRACGIRDPEAEVQVTLAHLRTKWFYRVSKDGRRQDMTASHVIQDAEQSILSVVVELRGRKDPDAAPPALPSSAVSPQPVIPKKPRKVFNGIGKILSGVVAGTGNVLIGTGAIPATGGASAAGVIASSALSVGLIMQGVGDLRGE